MNGDLTHGANCLAFAPQPRVPMVMTNASCAVSQDSPPRRHAPRLQIDRIGCLGIGFEGNHIASTGRRVNDEFTETTVKTEQELSVLRLVDEPADASISCEFEVRQYIVELQPGHGLALAEIEAIRSEPLVGRLEHC